MSRLKKELQNLNDALKKVEEERESLTDEFRVKELQFKNVNSVNSINSGLKR